MISGSRLYPYGITVPTRSPRSAFALIAARIFLLVSRGVPTSVLLLRYEYRGQGQAMIYRPSVSRRECKVPAAIPNRHGSKIKSAASQKNSGVVAAIAAGGAYCNAPSSIPQGQRRKMFPDGKKFLKLFFAQKKPPDFLRSGGGENTFLRFLIYIIAILIIYFRHSVPNTDMSLYILRRIGRRLDFFTQSSHKYA